MKANRPKLYLDMDGVLVDFDRYCQHQGLTPEEVKQRPGSYAAMPWVEGAEEALVEMNAMGYDLWLMTKPPTGMPHAMADKAQWVCDNIPQLMRKLIMTPDKSVVGTHRDVLIDDRPHRANAWNFPGHLIQFTDWPKALQELRAHRQFHARMFPGTGGVIA